MYAFIHVEDLCHHFGSTTTPAAAADLIDLISAGLKFVCKVRRKCADLRKVTTLMNEVLTNNSSSRSALLSRCVQSIFIISRLALSFSLSTWS